MRREHPEAGAPAGAPRSADELREALSRLSGRRVLLQLTDNRRRMVSIRHGGPDFLEVRMQRMFLSAPDFVVRAVADMAAGRPADRDAIRRFVAGSPAAAPDGRLPERIKRPAAPARGGAYHDIRLYADELNATYLGNRSTAEIAWGRKISAGIRRSIQFGSYDPTRNRITMNRRLDRAGIPRYFVEYILFHEMLHEVLGIGERADGRRDIHGRVFKLMESTYPDFDKALRYERELCKQLHLL